MDCRQVYIGTHDYRNPQAYQLGLMRQRNYNYVLYNNTVETFLTVYFHCNYKRTKFYASCQNYNCG